MLSVKNAVSSGAKVTIDGVVLKENLNLKKVTSNIQYPDISQYLSDDGLVTLNGKIYKAHSFYDNALNVWDIFLNRFVVPDGSTYTSAKIPVRPYTIIVYKNQIHVFGNPNSNTYSGKYHYRWNGTSWIKVEEAPINIDMDVRMVVINKEIHAIGIYESGVGDTAHYKWDGSMWTKVGNLPFSFNSSHCKLVAFRNEIHLIGFNLTDADSTSLDHYKWDGLTLTLVSTLPYRTGGSCCAVVLNDEIHILGSSYSESYAKNHYKWDGTSWTQLNDLPYSFAGGGATVLDGTIYICGGTVYDTGYGYNFYALDYTRYEKK